jgi:hypothetical protein
MADQLAAKWVITMARNTHLLGPIGNIPPAEFEAMYYQRQETPTMGVGLT